MGLITDLLSELAEIGVEVVSDQLKSDETRKDRINKSGKKAEEFLQRIEKEYKNKNYKSGEKSSVKTNIKRENLTESKTPIEAEANKNIEDIPIEERLKRYKETKRKAEAKSLQREKNDILEFTNLENKKRTKKYKQILKSRNGARDAFIYSTIFEKKV
ncbi:hypothetical protein [Helcococcus sueciensis]|uniref:hypothetical protein n=1 Tax=Helcococcus sueciensis TaxID=241555 RepID=UPI00041E4524|nr:hypothetical protein [Helcococcus sueciensis]